MQPGWRVRALPAKEALLRLPELVDVLVDCVLGGASVSFMWPFSHKQAATFWQTIIQQLDREEAMLLVAEPAERKPIRGTTVVHLKFPDNQPHRGELAKVLVHREARRQGLGEALVQAGEAADKAVGKTLLVLDTVPDQPAERLYLKLGWQPVGIIPGFARMPDGSPCDTRFFYKQL